jgi:hypothetical protein
MWIGCTRGSPEKNPTVCRATPADGGVLAREQEVQEVSVRPSAEHVAINAGGLSARSATLEPKKGALEMRTPPGVEAGGVPGAHMTLWRGTRSSGLRLENVWSALEVPAVR